MVGGGQDFPTTRPGSPLGGTNAGGLPAQRCAPPQGFPFGPCVKPQGEGGMRPAWPDLRRPTRSLPGACLVRVTAASSPSEEPTLPNGRGYGGGHCIQLSDSWEITIWELTLSHYTTLSEEYHLNWARFIRVLGYIFFWRLACSSSSLEAACSAARRAPKLWGPSRWHKDESTPRHRC